MILILFIFFVACLENTYADAVYKSVTMPVSFSQGEPASIITIGDKTIPLMIDSGASKNFLVLSKRALKNIKVTYTGQTHCFKALDGPYCFKKFIIPIVKIGNFILHDVPGEEMQHLWDANTKGFIETEAAKNGIIGLALLTKFNVLFYFKNKQITYMPFHFIPSNLDLKQCHPVKADFSQGIVANFFFNNKMNKMVLDTGANISIINPKNTNKTLYYCNKDHINDFKNCKIDKIALFADQKPENFYVRSFNLPFDGFIGSTYLLNHRVFIDSFNKTVYFC